MDILETKFNRQRNNDFIQILTDSVTDFEYRSGNRRKRWSV